jgi:hypothetical protein
MLGDYLQWTFIVSDCGNIFIVSYNWHCSFMYTELCDII